VQEWTEGSDLTPAVPVSGAIATKINQAAAATVHCAYNPRTQVDLRRLARPSEGITSFTVTGPRRTPATEEEMGQPAVEPLIRGTADLMISD
jgi:hypothetical protein